MKHKKWLINSILIFIVLLLAVLPLLFNQDSEFPGADGQAEEAIIGIQPDYEPWFQPLWAPPGGETESLLFSLQAAIGAGIIGYYLGKTAKRKEEYTK